MIQSDSLILYDGYCVTKSSSFRLRCELMRCDGYRSLPGAGVCARACVYVLVRVCVCVFAHARECVCVGVFLCVCVSMCL